MPLLHHLDGRLSDPMVSGFLISVLLFLHLKRLVSQVFSYFLILTLFTFSSSLDPNVGDMKPPKPDLFCRHSIPRVQESHTSCGSE